MAESRRRTSPASATEPISVVVIDDHPLWREMLVKVLGKRDDVQVVAEGGDGDEAVRLCAEHRPQIVLMDIDLPGTDGIAACVSICAADPDVRVLMLSAWEDRATVIEAIRAGARGYLPKTAGAGEVADAILRAQAGELVLPPGLVPFVLEAMRDDGDVTGVPALTPGELEVLELMAEGRTNQAITERLHLSIKTIEARVTSIYGKLQLEPASEDHRRVLAVLAFQEHSGSSARPASRE